MVPLKFNLKQLDQLGEDFKQSPRLLKLIIPRVLREQLRALRKEMRSLVPKGRTGALRRSFGYSVKRRQDVVRAVFGFLTGKNVSAGTAIAANVLQAGAHIIPKKAKHLWIPLPNNVMGNDAIVSPRALLSGGGFIQKSKLGTLLAFSKAGAEITPLFVLRSSVTIPPRPMAIEAGVQARIPKITAEIEETIREVLEARGAARKAVSGGG